ncbi:MAG: CBS domain-containing protein [Betaproteobacteria bacterium]|nr:CBS domain-containing protein [Betaproteobacteria bacterium]MDE2622604.1 CBS domain-containing protein [Betaproteobacteria bacterium]
MTHVQDLLSAKPGGHWSITPDAKVIEALRLMADKNVGALMVMKDGHLVGMLSERDYARKVALMGKTPVETPVSDIMASPVVTVTLDQTLEDCMTIMTEKRMRHLPVVNGERVVGLLSIGDLVKAVIQEQQETIQRLYNRF